MHETPSSSAPKTLVAARPERTSELGLALTRILRDPIAGLRASMQSVARDARTTEGVTLADSLDDILEQVSRLARDVESLAKFATPQPVRPLRCSLDEILHAATRNLPDSSVERLKVARPAASFNMTVDGPLVASSLHHLIEAALDTEADWLLLQVRREAGRTKFALVEGSAGPSFEPVNEQVTSKQAQLGLGLRLAHRDICRMEGELHVEHTERGYTRIVVTIPDSVDTRRSSER